MAGSKIRRLPQALREQLHEMLDAGSNSNFEIFTYYDGRTKANWEV